MVDVVRPPEPDRVDLDEPAEQEEKACHREEQAERARRLAGKGRHADHLPLALALPAELRVVPRRDQNCGMPGNGPPQTSCAISAPMKGMESATEYPIASPIPESRSSTSE